MSSRPAFMRSSILRNRFAAFALTLLLPGHAIVAGGPPPVAPGPAPTLTFPRFAPGQPMHLVAYGDTRFTDPSETSRTNPRIREWLVQRIALEHPRAVLLTGDTPYRGAEPADWEQFQKETAAWREQHILQLPTTGNHEIYGGASQGIANYLKNFPQIARHRYYSALLGNVEVVSVDCTEPIGPTSPQARWFAAQLDHLPAQVDFLLILYHMPLVVDRQTHLLLNMPGPNALSLRGLLEARLPRLRPRVLVLNGHIHNYERFERQSVEYVVTGGGGAEPYPVLLRGDNDLYRDTGFPVYHYLTLDVTGTRLHVVMWKVKDPLASALEVEAKDEFTLDAPARTGKVRPASK